MSVLAVAAALPQSGGRCSKSYESCGKMLPEDGGTSDASTECAASSPGGTNALDPDEAVAPSAAEPAAPKARRTLAALPTPGALVGVKSKRRPVLTLSVEGRQHANMEAAVCLGSRTSLAGLSEAEAADLVQCLVEGRDDCAWQITRHEQLRVAVMRDFGEADFDAAAANAPHVICMYLDRLKSDKAVCSVLRNFHGALLVIEGPHEAQGEAEERERGEEVAMLLHALGVSARWSAAAGSFEQVSVPAAPVGEMTGDLRLRDLEKSPELLKLVAEKAQPLYEEFFHEDMMEELRSWTNPSCPQEGAMVAFLVSPPGAGDRRPQAEEDAEPSERSELLGFIVYKFWGPPLRAMSILRVAVPHKYRMMGFGRQITKWAMERAKQKPRHECAKVTLCAMPEAIAFYDRLKFTPIPVEDLAELPEEEDRGERLPGALWMEFRCGRAYKPVGRQR